MRGLTPFGEPVILFDRGFFPDDVMQHYLSAIVHCDDLLKDFNPNLDYIVPMGDSCMVAIVAMWLVDNDKMPAKFLKYDKKLNGYYPIEIGEYDE